MRWLLGNCSCWDGAAAEEATIEVRECAADGALAEELNLKGALLALKQEADQYTSKATICDALAQGHTALIRAEWFAEQKARGKLLLRRQEMESEHPDSLVTHLAPDEIWTMHTSDGDFINVSEGGRFLILALTYPWQSPEHPDPEGKLLEVLASFLGRLASDLAPHGKSIAVFLDYGSLHQEPRTSQEAALFQRGVESVHLWYAHQAIQVWAVPQVAGEQRPYHSRGWATFEWRLAQLSTSLLFDLSRVKKPDAPLVKDWGGGYVELSSLVAARVRPEPPMRPDLFEATIEGKSFAYPCTDMPLIKKQYSSAFKEVFSSAERLDFSGLGWSEADVADFAFQTLPICIRLRELALSGNNVTDATVKFLAAACGQLQVLLLDNCKGVTDEAIVALAAACHQLQRLDLDNCYGVTDGSVRLLATSCTQLQWLSLENCSLVTDASVALLAEHCSQLRKLWLSGCSGVTDTSVRLLATSNPACQVFGVARRGSKGRR